MELWIRSQDKMKLIRAIDLGIFEEQEGYTIYYDDSIDNILGTYATKERALEVLDEIHQRLINLGTIGIAPDSYIVLPKDTSNVYEMPKE